MKSRPDGSVKTDSPPGPTTSVLLERIGWVEGLVHGPRGPLHEATPIA